MQIFDQAMEERCIITLTHPEVPESVRSTLLGKLTKDSFHYPPCIAAFSRVNLIAQKRFKMTDLEDLLSDPALDEDFRDILRESSAEPVRNRKKLNSMLEALDKWRKIRIVYTMANDALEEVEKGSVDIDKLLNKLTNQFVAAQKNISEEDTFIQIGQNNNADELAHDAIHKLAEQLIKTGFTAFDNQNGGVPEEGVFILAATTSGGKSVMLKKLLVNLYLHSCKKVHNISLEMGDIQEMRRLLSMLSGVPFYKIKQNKTSPKEKERMAKAYADFKQHGIKNNCVFSHVSPKKNVSLDDCLRAVKPYKFDIIGIDYLGLLDGMDEGDQWKNLSAAVSVCKKFSRETGCLMIILVQLDAETNTIRYSKGMKEHADIVWMWNYSKKEQRDLKILPIDVAKARDGELIQFNLGERFDVMNIENMDSGGDFASENGGRNTYDTDEDADKPTKKKGKKKKSLDEDGVDVSDSPKKKKKKRTLDDDDDAPKKKKKVKKSEEDGDDEVAEYALS